MIIPRTNYDLLIPWYTQNMTQDDHNHPGSEIITLMTVVLLWGNLDRDGDFVSLQNFVREFEKIETTHGRGMICTKSIIPMLWFEENIHWR